MLPHGCILEKLETVLKPPDYILTFFPIYRTAILYQRCQAYKMSFSIVNVCFSICKFYIYKKREPPYFLFFLNLNFY